MHYKHELVPGWILDCTVCIYSAFQDGIKFLFTLYFFIEHIFKTFSVATTATEDINCHLG